MARRFGPKRTSVSVNRRERRKVELDDAILECLNGRLLGTQPRMIREYVARFVFKMMHSDELPHQSVYASIKRLHRSGKIRIAMGDGWIIDPKGPCGHMVHPSRRRG